MGSGEQHFKEGEKEILPTHLSLISAVLRMSASPITIAPLAWKRFSLRLCEMK